MGRYGCGEQSERGERLIAFAIKSNVFIANPCFQQESHRKWAWLSLDGIH